jgi:hypothetical protein
MLQWQTRFKDMQAHDVVLVIVQRNCHCIEIHNRPQVGWQFLEEFRDVGV